MKYIKKGFTLIELLLVVTILSVLAVSVFVALNPARRLIDTKNARRSTDVDTILTAIHQYIIDNKGVLPTGLSAGMSERMLGSGNTALACPANANAGCAYTATSPNFCLELGTLLAPYLKSVPVDPNGTAANWSAIDTGYSVVVDGNGIVTVKACGAEPVPPAAVVPISISR